MFILPLCPVPSRRCWASIVKHWARKHQPRNTYLFLKSYRIPLIYAPAALGGRHGIDGGFYPGLDGFFRIEVPVICQVVDLRLVMPVTLVGLMSFEVQIRLVANFHVRRAGGAHRAKALPQPFCQSARKLLVLMQPDNGFNPNM